MNYNQIDTDIYPVNHHGSQHFFHSQAVHSSHKNLNFEFAVDFDSKFRKAASTRNMHNITETMMDVDELPLEGRPRSDSAHGRLGNYDFHLKEALAQELRDNTLMFDTFEHCLHVSNEMESAMAYYYQDEGNKDCFKFEEIYNLREVDLSVPIDGLNKTKEYSNSLDVPLSPRSRSLSLGEIVKKSHLESDIEHFIEDRSNIIIKEKETPHYE